MTFRKKSPSRVLPETSPWDKEHDRDADSPIYEPLWQMLHTFLKYLSVETVLDFGCGDGAYASLMAEEGLQITGIDLSEKAIQKANARQCHGGTFIRADHMPDTLPSGFFDMALMLNSLHCLTSSQRSALFEQTRRVLKPKGYFFASVLSLEDASYPRWEWEEIEAGTFRDENGKIFHFFSEDELVKELSWLDLLKIMPLQNIHPTWKRKSALFVITAQFVEKVPPTQPTAYGKGLFQDLRQLR